MAAWPVKRTMRVSGQMLRDLDGGFDAVDVGHQDVGEDELGAGAAGAFDGLLAAVGGLGDEAVAVEDLDDGVGDEGFVVDNEDAGGARRDGRRRRLRRLRWRGCSWASRC